MSIETPWRQDTASWWNEGAFLYVGRMGDNKGVSEILAAWLGLRRRFGARCPDLWLAGGAPEEIAGLRSNMPRPEALARYEGCGRVRWWGYLDEPGISALLLKASALIMHSAYEPGGRVVLEAMTQGVPVIATPHGFARDLVRDWVSGFLVPHGDVGLLRRRMAHFVSQPLLGPSLGLAARATAQAALADWDFYRAHGRIYQQAASSALPGPAAAPAGASDIIADPLPRGLVGRYPFAAAVPDTQAALGAARRLLHLPAARCRIRRLPSRQAALRWELEAKARRWTICHLYSTYADRALWDRGAAGPLFLAGVDRRRRSARASRLPGFAALLADPTGEIHLAETMPAAAPDSPARERRQAALGPLQALWAYRLEGEDGRELRDLAHAWWAQRAESPWRANPLAAAALRTASLRVAWAELAEKLRRGDIRAGARLATAFGAAAPYAERVAEGEEKLVPFCFQHGDLQPASVRVGQAGACLAGGETSGPGWWGRDAAHLVLRFAGPDELATAGGWDEALDQICSSPVLRPVVGLWTAIEATLELAKARVLGGAAPVRAEDVERLLARLGAPPSR